MLFVLTSIWFYRVAEECQVFRDDLVCQDFLGLKDHLDHKDQR